MTTVTWLRVLRLLSKRPKASNPNSGNAFAGPHQGLQNLSEGKKVNRGGKGGRERKTELVGSSGQPMPQPLQADDTKHGPVMHWPHHMELT